MSTERQNSILSAFAKLDKLLDRYIADRPTPGVLGSHAAFTWDGSRNRLEPVQRPVRIDPAGLLGIEDQKARLLANTKGFVAGRAANNALLWGERGAGKSSLIKSLLTAFSGTDLRMVQVLKHDILTIRTLLAWISDAAPLRFIIFIDDLSFEESQTDYKEMKTLMDGGLEQMPDNLLFYATSNRKHLIPTRFSDSESDDVRPGDAIEEKVSLADRFGLRLGFSHMDQDTYLEVVDLYASRAGLDLDREVLHREAIRWALAAGGRNGRTAEQFVRSLP